MPPSELFDRVIQFYGKTLQWVLRHQTPTLLVAVATLVLTVLLYIIVPKGFFPVQDTGVILGISEAPQSISFPGMAKQQQALARVILQDPAVESLSSFIGVDGTNTTLNSGRILINLKPLEERKVSASEIIRRLQRELAKVEGITLYMQPVQDLTVDTRVSRTQYNYALEDPDIDELNSFAPRLVETLRTRPELRDVSSDQQNKGLRVSVAIDRSTASRLGITPQLIDDTLYDAFGQRQVSTMFTQLNQYRVVLAVKPDFQQGPDSLQTIYLRGAGGGQVPLSAIVTGFGDNRTAPHQPPGPVSGGDGLLQPGPRSITRRGSQGGRVGHAADGAARKYPGQLPGHGPGLPGLTDQRTAFDPGSPRDGLHCARGAL